MEVVVFAVVFVVQVVCCVCVVVVVVVVVDAVAVVVAAVVFRLNRSFDSTVSVRIPFFFIHAICKRRGHTEGKRRSATERRYT